ncbi:MAG: Lrp/AsnC family transcriptional regulator, partial [Microbacterium sp.]|uniref:Lrp/AsnC family transcriptional regulator n=1 Tax=Microbacterium sp. TaxID=51671 RepID=UPI003A839C48
MSNPQSPVRAASTALDDLDRAILATMLDAPELTTKVLAQRVGAAESTCAYRLRALRQRGVITPGSPVLDLAALGRPLQAVIRVRMGGHTLDGVDTVFDALESTPGVLQVFHVSGGDDFLVHVAVADAGALRDIVLEHITVHPAVRATETQIVFERREGAGARPDLR